jgi:hypothetical protein
VGWGVVGSGVVGAGVVGAGVVGAGVDSSVVVGAGLGVPAGELGIGVSAKGPPPATAAAMTKPQAASTGRLNSLATMPLRRLNAVPP